MKKILMMLMMLATMFVGMQAYAGDLVNVNTATVEQLQTIKGIGDKTSAAIVAYRNEHGDFKAVEGLTAVKGIGAKKLENAKGMLTVSTDNK